jgi:predicted nuclease of restriction endonuclease-like (RecB) superfamily
MPTKRTITTYPKLLSELKEKIRQARQRASLSVNAHLLSLYWEIGHAILQQQDQKGWGSKVIDRLASDLKGDFQDMKGFSVRNLKYMRAFAGAHPNFMQLSAPKNPTIKKQKDGIVQAHPAQMGADALIPIV